MPDSDSPLVRGEGRGWGRGGALTAAIIKCCTSWITRYFLRRTIVPDAVCSLKAGRLPAVGQQRRLRWGRLIYLQLHPATHVAAMKRYTVRDRSRFSGDSWTAIDRRGLAPEPRASDLYCVTINGRQLHVDYQSDKTQRTTIVARRGVEHRCA